MCYQKSPTWGYHSKIELIKTKQKTVMTRREKGRERGGGGRGKEEKRKRKGRKRGGKKP